MVAPHRNDSSLAELEFVKDLAREAAGIALERASQVIPQEKANLSYVTELDRDLERFIRDRLKKRFPDDAVSGEELELSAGSNTRRWSIDPIDGTGNLVHRLPLWAISIGLLDRGEPILGVISIPPLNELYWATRGGGCLRDGERIQAAIDADSFHPQDNVCVGTNALRAVDTRTLPGRLRDLGSACSELAFLSSGRLACCTFLGEQEHDLAAGVLLATEAGCRIATIDGKRMNPAEFVASTPVSVVTFLAPPRRLQALLRSARRLPESDGR